MPRIAARLASLTPLAIAASVSADTIVQEGFLSGSAGPPNQHVITLEQFDDQGGTRVLNAVRVDLVTTLFAETVTNGEGGTVDFLASLWADYFLPGGSPIAETDTLIQGTADNSGPPVATLYLDVDEQSVMYDQPEDLAVWIGGGTIDLSATSQLTITADPPDVVDFGASGSVTWMVSYEFSAAPTCPADLDGDGLVGVGDLLTLLAGWGTPAADLDGDGTTGVGDLLTVLSAWGACGP